MGGTYYIKKIAVINKSMLKYDVHTIVDNDNNKIIGGET